MRWHLAWSALVAGIVAIPPMVHAQLGSGAGAGAQNAPGAAATADWQAANREVIGLVQAGRYAQAEARAKAAIALCPAEPPTQVICRTQLQENTAWAQARAGRHADAEASYREALVARERVFAANDPAIGDSAAALGFFYIDRQRWDDAATQLERAVEILGQAGPDRTPTLGAAYARLADAYRAQGRTTAALTTAREAVETMTRRAGADSGPAQVARANLTAQLRDAGQSAEAIDATLAALRPETLPLDQRVRLTIEAVTTATVLGRTEAVRAAFDTTLSLVGAWAQDADAARREAFARLALAGSELALTRGDPDTALELARRAKAALPANAASAALIQEARALLDQGQAEQAATLLTEATAPGAMASAPLAQRAWMVRALMDAGRFAQARAQLSALQASVAGKPEEQSTFGASLLQLAAQLAERQGDQRAALAALEQAIGYLPAPGPGTAHAVQAVNLRRDAIRLRAILGQSAGTAAALTALLDTQMKAQMPQQSVLETRMLMGWFGAESRQAEIVRAQIAAIDAALPALEAQAPRGAATMASRLAELSLTVPGGAGAAAAMAYLERARLGYERTGQSRRDEARVGVLRGRVLTRLDRAAEAVQACQAAAESLTALLPGAEQAWRDALGCVVRAELQVERYPAAAASAARLLEHLPAENAAGRAEAMRLLSEAQSGQNETDAADRTLRQALDLVATVTPRRNGLRAELWGAISTNLQRAGRYREARNAAVAQRQISGEDNAGAGPIMQSLRNEATALLALHQLDEAISVLDRAERLRVALLRADPGALAELDGVLARVELARGRFAEAAAIADRVIAVYRAQGMPPRAGFASVLETRASIQLALGAFVAAETAQREAVSLLAGARGLIAEAALARLQLARIIARRGDVPAAEREQAAALELLVTARGPDHASIALARLDTVPALIRAGRISAAEALIDACEAAVREAEDRQRSACLLARAAMTAQAGSWVASRDAASAALGLLQSRGDADRPALVAPLLARAEAAEALSDMAAVEEALATLLPLLPRADLEERLRGAALQARRELRNGHHGGAAAAGQDGLALVAANLPATFAFPLVRLTEVTADALLAQGHGGVAAGLWRAAMARLDGWGAGPDPRAAALRGLGMALTETPELTAALQAWQDAVSLESGDTPARRAALAGLVRTAIAAGRFDLARTRAEELAGGTAAEAAILAASLRAEIAEEAGDSVSALLEWWRAASLAGELPTEPGLAAVALLRTARAALAAGQRSRAESLLAQARAGLGEAVPASDAALAALELEFRLKDDNAGAAVALEAWRAAVQRRFGAASRAALRPELALAARELRAGDTAEAAARYAVALGRAEQLHGRSSLLWARTALDAAQAAERLGDNARAAMLREQSQVILNPVTR